MTKQKEPELKPGHFLDPTKQDHLETKEDRDRLDDLIDAEKKKVAKKLEK